MANTRGFALLAASFLTSQRQTEVADIYSAWIATKVNLTTAENALLGAARSSKNSATVVANAAALYASTEHDPPTITSVTPSTGTTAGGTAVSIAGTNLAGATVVTFGGTTATSIVITDTAITCVTPAKTAGAKDVIVTTPDGTVTSVGAFTYA